MPAVIVGERCIGCGICVRRCPLDALAMVGLGEPQLILGRTVRKTAIIKYPDECWHCGVCRLDCPTDAIRFSFAAEMLDGVRRDMPVPSGEEAIGRAREGLLLASRDVV